MGNTTQTPVKNPTNDTVTDYHNSTENQSFCPNPEYGNQTDTRSKNSSNYKYKSIKTAKLSVDKCCHRLKNFVQRQLIIIGRQNKFESIKNQHANSERFAKQDERIQSILSSQQEYSKQIQKLQQEFSTLKNAGALLVVAVGLLLLLIWACKRKSTRRPNSTEMDLSEPTIEDSVDVVSFAWDNRDIHKKIASTVISVDKICQVHVGGPNESDKDKPLQSKVCFVFIDKNERQIILETKEDISRTRTNFVEGQVKKGRTQVIVIYCQHAGSHNMTRLYDRSLGNINKQETLRQLQRQNRVLSIDKEFSEYQSNYLKLILNEAFD